MEPSTAPQGFGVKVKKFFDTNPTLVRGIIVATAGLIATFVGREVISNEAIEAVMTFFIAVSALISALWTRGVVIAENKVVAWKPDPDTSVVAPGPAMVESNEIGDIVDLAGRPMRQGEVRERLADAA